MRMGDFLKGETVAAENCLMRHQCPVGMLCMTTSNENFSPLFPTDIEVRHGDIFWTDLRSEQRVFIIRSGVFSCVAHVSEEREIPFALYGRSSAMGLAELYVPRTTADTYHLKVLVPGRVCTFLAKSLRRHLESLSTPIPQKILTGALVNTTAAALIQSAIVSKPLLNDKVTLLLVILQELTALGGPRPDVLHIAHGEIAELVMSDRGSVTRVLNKLEKEGHVDLGYKSVKINKTKPSDEEETIGICSMLRSTQSASAQRA